MFVDPLARRVFVKFTDRVGKEFPSDEALKKYLHEHPDADPKNHSVKKDDDKGEGGEKKKPWYKRIFEKKPESDEDRWNRENDELEDRVEKEYQRKRDEYWDKKEKEEKEKKGK